MEEEAERGGGLRVELPDIVFLGTPDFAVPSLQKLVASGARIRLVVTQPDRPKGRGKKVAAPAVKSAAERLSLPVYQPERVKSSDALEKILSCGASCAVVVAYGQLFPQRFLDGFPLGALNVHASLLPRFRGAAPIQRSILAGDTRTGVSIMLLNAGMDTGPVLAQREVAILDADTSGSLHDKLAEVGAELLCETLVKWRSGAIQPQPQDDSHATDAPPIRKEELRLSWQLSATQLVNIIRAFDPWPGAYTSYGGRRIKCYHAALLNWQVEGKPGEVVGTTREGLVVLGGDGKALAIGEMQLEGQRRLASDEFLRGHPLPSGTLLQ